MELSFPKSLSHFTSFELSLYRRLAFFLFFIATLAIFSVSLIRQATTHATNPFIAFLDIFPGEAQPIETRGFECKLNSNYYKSEYTICTSTTSDNAFPKIILRVENGRISQSTFLVRGNKLKFGDLMQTLTMDHLQTHTYEIFFFWNKLFVDVKTSQMKHATALRPIESITFTNVDFQGQTSTFSSKSHKS